jgi:hypothetical protein
VPCRADAVTAARDASPEVMAVSNREDELVGGGADILPPDTLLHFPRRRRHDDALPRPVAPVREEPRYFCDERGEAIYLTGSHTWASFQELRSPGEPPFDYASFLDMLEAHGHNYTRMWQWCHTTNAPWTRDPVEITPCPGSAPVPARPATAGPGSTWAGSIRVLRAPAGPDRGGRPAGDLRRPDDVRGLGDALEQRPSRLLAVPSLHQDNNVNGVHGGHNRDGKTNCTRSKMPTSWRVQKAFVRQVIDAVGDLDNVLFEVVNEVPFDQHAYLWHHFMVDFIHETERDRPKRHPRRHER